MIAPPNHRPGRSLDLPWGHNSSVNSTQQLAKCGGLEVPTRGGGGYRSCIRRLASRGIWKYLGIQVNSTQLKPYPQEEVADIVHAYVGWPPAVEFVLLHRRVFNSTQRSKARTYTKKRAWSCDLRSSPDRRRPNMALRASVRDGRYPREEAATSCVSIRRLSRFKLKLKLNKPKLNIS